MSIATDEALHRWPEIDTSTGGVILQSYAERYAMRRSGFVEGAAWQSQREPTEAEIEAAAKAYVLHHIDFTRFIEDSDGNTNMQPCSCGKEFPNKNTRLRHVLHELLLAARKAVTA